MGLAAPKLKIAFGPNDKVGHGLIEAVQTFEIDVAAVHNDIGAGLRNNFIQHEDIGNAGVSDIDEYRNGSLNIDHRMQFHPAVTITEGGPRKQRQTQIDRGGIQCVNGTVEIQSQIRIHIQRPRPFDQTMSEIRINPPIAILVRVGQCGTFDHRAKPGPIEMFLVCGQTYFNVTDTFAIGQLSESHRQKLFPTGEPANSFAAAVASHADVEIIVRNELQDLAEDRLFLAHAYPPSWETVGG